MRSLFSNSGCCRISCKVCMRCECSINISAPILSGKRAQGIRLFSLFSV
ncbi:Uncharacterised protein [Vibrio cholerae]|nr:Uncharacterised protein [Vibrio cholerae]